MSLLRRRRPVPPPADDGIVRLRHAAELFYRHERERLEGVGITEEVFMADWQEHYEHPPTAARGGESDG